MYNMDPYGYYVNLLWPHVLNVLVVFAYLGESVAYLRQLGALDESDPEAMVGIRSGFLLGAKGLFSGAMAVSFREGFRP